MTMLRWTPFSACRWIFIISIGLFCWNDPASAGAQVPGTEEVLPWSRCLELAIQFNPDVQRTREQIEQVEGNIIVERASFLPQAASGGVSTPPNVSIGISVPIYTKTRDPTFAAFPAARTAARANAQLALMEMAYALRNSYVQAYYNQELVPVAEKSVQLLEDRLKRAPSLFEAGKMTRADLESLQVRAAIAKSDLDSTKNLAEISRLDVLQITGLPASDPRVEGRFVTDFKMYATQETDPQKLVAASLASRQDLVLLKNLKKVNDAFVLVDRAAYYPQAGAGISFSNSFQPPDVTSTLFHTIDPNGYHTNFDQQNFRHAGVTFSTVANWRVFDGGATRGNVQSAQTDVVKEDILLNKTIDQIPRQIDLALEIIGSTDKLIKNIQTNGKGEENLRSLQRAYDAGQVSQVEILDAQDELILQQQDLLRLESGHEQAMAALDRIVGQTFRVEITLP